MTADIDQQRKKELYATVKLAVEKGLSVWPPEQDGSKKPYGSQWKDRQTTPATVDELRFIYNDKKITGVGTICGAVSGNLETMDFDEKGIYEGFRQRAIEAGLGTLLERMEKGYLEYTPNGVHVPYRCTKISGNTKLATRPKRPEEMKDEHDKTKTLIETRGEGGYVIVAPTFGSVNPAGTYDLVSGSIETIPTITPEERGDLFNLARTFHVDPEEKVLSDGERIHRESSKAGGRPGDDFNERATWQEILEPTGWTFVYSRGGVTYWRRPGKERGISASTGHAGTDFFHNWSSSTPFETNRSYGKFSVFTILNHSGDFQAAAKELVGRGYGERKIAMATQATTLEQRGFPVRGFPFEVLPDPFDRLTTEYATALQIPREIMAMIFLTILSGTIGNSVVMQIKRGWVVPPFIWFMLVRDTGTGKSHPQEEAMRPIKELQAKEATKHKRAMQEHEIALAAHKKNRDGDPPCPPVMKHFYSSNFTFEALIPMYQVNPRGLIIAPDELAGLFKGLNQYKAGGNDKEMLLNLFDARDLKSDRKGESGYARNSGAAVIGGIQPGILPKVFADSDYDNGLIYRYIPMVAEFSAPRFTEDGLSESAEATWKGIVDWTYKIPIETDSLSGASRPKKLIPVSDALAIWKQYHDRYSLSMPYVSKKFRGYLPKLITYCLKFITVLHVAECYRHDTLVLKVSAETVNSAIKLTDYFAGQASKLTNGATEKMAPYHAVIAKALDSLRGEVSGGKLSLNSIREKVNKILPANMQLESTGNKRLSNWIQEMGFTVIEGAGHYRYLIWDNEKISLELSSFSSLSSPDMRSDCEHNEQSEQSIGG